MQDVERAKAVSQKILDNIEQVIVGKRQAVELAVVTLICQGHALIEDVPGVGKTMLARSLARSTGCEFKRIQFTPDLLPSDITGVSIYNQKTAQFEFKAGPVISQLVLADEINRATPKNPVGAPRSHGREAGYRRRCHPRPAPAVHRHGHSESNRV